MTDYEVALSLLDSKQRYSETKVKSNPKFYKDPNELANLPRTDQTLTVQDIWNKDKAKLDLAKSKGITLVQIWEDEIKNNFENIIKQLEELFQQFLKE